MSIAHSIPTALLVLFAVACGNSTTPDRDSNRGPADGDPRPDAEQTRVKRDKEEARTSAADPLTGILGAFGLAGQPVPDGLEPGAECPPVGTGAAAEMAAQAAAPIPLTPGLTMAYTWMRTPQEEYECLIQVQSVDANGIDTTLSCDGAPRKDPYRRRICREDLRNARMLHTLYGAVKVIDASGEDAPETIVGATAFSLSSAEFALLKKTGSMTHRHVELGSDGQLSKDGIGELRVAERGQMRVIVNDRPVDIPVVTARGTAKWWIRGQRLETAETLVVLDDERFPLLIDNHSTAENAASRIHFIKVSHSSGTRGPGSLEGQLGAGEQVDVYGIYFDFNSDRIRVESEPVLTEIGDVMNRHRDWRLSIQGHTDNIGGDGASNLELSRRRSEAVRNALVTRFGISADRLSTGGHGASAPKDTNDTPEGRARNRRVELRRL
jgi:outer membrane protein OmpA-like peptidoglycan-associated protein